jgi:hypothetical protein
MPLRKRKGRRGPKLPPPAETKESTPSQDNGEKGGDGEAAVEPVTATNDASMDEEERRARETIALLAQKYQVKLTEETSDSLDIIRVEDSAEISPVEPETRGESKEKEKKMTSKILPKKRTKLQKQTQRGSSPAFKVPKPLAHHSTPAKDRNLFGFESLDSPLTLSPVTTTPAGRVPSLSERLSPKEEEGGGKAAKPSPYSRLRGTYDIPFKKKTPRRPAAQRRKGNSGEDRWAAQLNTQFSEIEQFELAVE